MRLTAQDVKDYIDQEDVSFIRLAFCDVFGKQKNVSIMATELDRAFESGIAIDASAVEGFGSEEKSDLFLFPDASTLSVLPWRPSQGRVVRMYCDIKYPDGTAFEMDCRHILKKAVSKAASEGIRVSFGAEHELIFSKQMRTVTPQGFRMTKRAIWISRPTTEELMCAEKSAFP